MLFGPCAGPFLGNACWRAVAESVVSWACASQKHCHHFRNEGAASHRITFAAVSKHENGPEMNILVTGPFIMILITVRFPF